MSNYLFNEWLNQSVHSQYINSIINVARINGLQPNDLLRRADIELEDNPDNPQVPVFKLLAIGHAFAEYFEDQALGFDIGWGLSPTAYGNLGFAMLCCSNLNETLELLQRYWPLVNQSISFFGFRRIERHVEVTLQVSPVLKEPFRRTWIEASLASWKRCVEILLNSSTPTIIECSYEKPGNMFKTPEQYGCIQYASDVNRVRLPEEFMHLPLPMANPAHKQIAVQLCEQDMILLGSRNRPLVAQVQNLMLLGPAGYPRLEHLAKQLSVSPRTLRRRLSQEGCSYKTLLEQSRRQDALRLLHNPSLSIQLISEMLGYASPTNFARVFRQWMNQSPSQYRHSGAGKICFNRATKSARALSRFPELAESS